LEMHCDKMEVVCSGLHPVGNASAGPMNREPLPQD
jgi:hypothetical protein